MSIGVILAIAIAATGVLLMRFRKRWLAKINIIFTNRITSLFAGWLPGFGPGNSGLFTREWAIRGATFLQVALRVSPENRGLATLPTGGSWIYTSSSRSSTLLGRIPLTNDALGKYYAALNSASELVMKHALADPSRVSQAHSAISDLQCWYEAVSSRPERVILRYAIHELQSGLYALLAGFYRHAFYSLRLALELCLLFTYFSTNRLQLAEWMQGTYDTNWATLLSVEDGVLSMRYSKAFFPEISEDVPLYREIAVSIYRELSEFVHGNQATWDLTPQSISYDAVSHEKWFQKLDSVMNVVVFALSLRFARELDAPVLDKLSTPTLDRMGHVRPIRAVFGGIPEDLHE